ncbi:hypothetical protein Ac2012v2_004453 [Leucoagaricus gongylophorus]
MSMSSAPLILYQHGVNMLHHQWIDETGNVAFTVSEASNSPTLLIKLHREPEWAQLHQSILGPEKSWFYLGPNKQPGFVSEVGQAAPLALLHPSRVRNINGKLPQRGWSARTRGPLSLFGSSVSRKKNTMENLP